MNRLRFATRRLVAMAVAGSLGVLAASVTHASDHLDTPTVIADPAADIGDLFAWTSPDGRRLNLVMTIVAHQFSDRLQYVFHVDSGGRFRKTTATTSIACRFDAANRAECWAGDADYVRGDASKPAGLEGRNRRLRVFAGLRDDPFFNNVKGVRAGLGVAAAALQGGAVVDAAGCPAFGDATSREVLDRWRHTDGGPATNFLAGWTSASLVVAIDLDVVDTGGKLLAVWASVRKPPADESPVAPRAKTDGIPARPTLGEPIERVGRALTGNGLLGPLAPNDVSGRRKEEYNRAAPSDWPQFSTDIQQTLGLYDGFDGRCGNQWYVDAHPELPTLRYAALANLLADDRLWIDARATACTRYLAVELAEAERPGTAAGDCGGRTPSYDVIDAFRSLLVGGNTTGADDGVEHDDRAHSTVEFPFLAAP